MGKLDVTKYIEDGFVAYSQGRVVVPPVGELVFENPPADVHIKYGYIKNDDYFAITRSPPVFMKITKSTFPPATGSFCCFLNETADWRAFCWMNVI
jgi:ornithine cyclodeaminase/alanine dehydrogenase-like protein (mu-crystallin family)